MVIEAVGIPHNTPTPPLPPPTPLQAAGAVRTSFAMSFPSLLPAKVPMVLGNGCQASFTWPSLSVPGKYNITDFQFLQILELPPSNSVLLVSYFRYNIRANCFNQQLQAWLFSRKGLTSMKAKSSFIFGPQFKFLLCLILYPSRQPPLLPSPHLPRLVLPWHSHPSLQRFLHSKHKNLFALKRSGKPQVLACGVYDNQGQTCFQRFFFNY